MIKLISAALFTVLAGPLSHGLELTANARAADLPKALSDRTCALKFSSEPGKSDKLTGFLISQDTIISVGHTQYFKDRLEIVCGINGRDPLRPPRSARHRHPQYDYQDEPESFGQWAQYDFSVIQINPVLSSNTKPMVILNDPILISKLIKENSCVYGGTGNRNNTDIRWLRPLFASTPPTIWKTSATHIAIRYEGPAVVISGDSGGPIFCQTDKGEYALAGLLQYGGTARSKATGQMVNIVGILIIRDEHLETIP